LTNFTLPDQFVEESHKVNKKLNWWLMLSNNSSLMRRITLPISLVFALKFIDITYMGYHARINTDPQNFKYIFMQKKLNQLW